MEINVKTLRDQFQAIQHKIVDRLGQLDGKHFEFDHWQKPTDSPLQGDGVSCILEDGVIFEKGGVAFSHVAGATLPPSATAQRPQLAGSSFEAIGVSLVLHPRNPYIPTVHMNVRCFLAFPKNADPVWWFGGGMDLTPYYGDVDDCRHFHEVCRQAVEPFGSHLYPEMKRACDQYFFLKHRGEARGIGGIFFDDFDQLGFENSWALTQAVGQSFLPAYVPIVKKHQNDLYGEREREFQAFRRGRYVEFNLVFDRGTLFGLQSGGRTESILLSMPPIVKWGYQWKPADNSPEALLYTDFLPPKDWLGCESH